MCGIAGIARTSGRGVSLDTLGRMGAALRHRGPDGYGFYVTPSVGFAHVRLSIVDLHGGAQPLASEGQRVVVTFNGEIYNYRSLTRELTALGHYFHTHSDTEVLVHGWEEWGAALFDRLNGQFAFALHDMRSGEVHMVRDRSGVRPLYYAEHHGDLLFASEAKALFATGEVRAVADPAGLDEVFTLWASRAPRSPFAGVQQLPPGHWATWRQGALTVRRWFSRDGSEEAELHPHAIEELDALLRAAVELRLHADVPVGGYLSGGLDSSIACALASRSAAHRLRTFSIAFADPRYNEGAHQQAVADEIGSDHSVLSVASDSLAGHFPAVVRHAETPLTRMAPVPMYLLAKLTREHGIKVVLTGEGADETFLGYDLFKEVQVRLFCLRHPESAARRRLFDRIYRFQVEDGGRGAAFWQRFFLEAGPPSDPLFSHQPRIRLTGHIRDFYSNEFRDIAQGTDVLRELRDSLPSEFSAWSPLGRAAWLEEEILLPGYLLSSQGDRMAMAHGVEGRFPFLDHRLAAFARRLPTSARLVGLKEKWILKRWARDVVPSSIQLRTKQPYRAPDITALTAPGGLELLEHLLSVSTTQSFGYFAPAAVDGLVRRVRSGRVTGVRESQALVAILSTHLWHEIFIRNAMFDAVPLPAERADVLLTPVEQTVA